MGKKVKRSLQAAEESQRHTESHAKDKFAEAEVLAKPVITSSRVSPQICCTVDPEAKEMLDQLHIDLTNKFRRRITTSMIIRSLIRSGVQRFDELQL